ncbi:hypothetical protein [Pseudomonas amygdali]|uniref:hypothetical protein n=1 Tax=Pseudomonas amygdali TaxID=47877 RepID=UPI000E3C436E|nr:hypothetical protein [Pseudomonas amygdali]
MSSPDAYLQTYQSIVSDVMKDRRLHLELAYGFVGGVIRVLLAGLRHAPWIADVLIGLFAVADPETFTQFLVELKLLIRPTLPGS